MGVCLLARRPPAHKHPSVADGGALGQADLTLRGYCERIPTVGAAPPHLSGAWGLWERVQPEGVRTASSHTLKTAGGSTRCLPG